MTKAGYSLLPTYDEIEEMTIQRTPRSTPPQEGNNDGDVIELLSFQRPSDESQMHGNSNQLPNVQNKIARQSCPRSCKKMCKNIFWIIRYFAFFLGLLGAYHLTAHVFSELPTFFRYVGSSFWFFGYLYLDFEIREHLKGICNVVFEGFIGVCKVVFEAFIGVCKVVFEAFIGVLQTISQCVGNVFDAIFRYN